MKQLTFIHRSAICLGWMVLFSFIAYAQIPQAAWTPVTGPYVAPGPKALSVGANGATTAVYASVNNGLYKTTDDGGSWQKITAITSAPSAVACAKDNPNLVYLAQETSLKKTMDGGATWADITGANITNTSFTTISIKPGTSNQTVYVGCDISGQNRTLWRTTDGGTTWNAEPTFDRFVKITKIVFDPMDNQKIYLSSSSGSLEEIGVWKSTDNGGSWQRKVNGITNSLKITSLAIHPLDPNIVYAGNMVENPGGESSVRVFISINGGDNWVNVGREDLCGEATDASVSSITFDATGSVMYFSTTSNNIYPRYAWRSIDDGFHWSIMSDGIYNHVEPLLADYNRVLFIESHPTQSGKAYLCSEQAIRMTTDGGVSWKEINAGIASRGFGAFAKRGNTMAAVISSSNDYGEGGMFESYDRGATWRTVHHTYQEFAGTDIAITPAGQIFYGVSGKLDQACAEGKSIMMIETNLDAPELLAYQESPFKVNSISYDPYRPDRIFLALRSGFADVQIGRSTNGGQDFDYYSITHDAASTINAIVPDRTSVDGCNYSKNIYAAVSGGSSPGVWRSALGGEQWSFLRFSSLPVKDFVSFAINPKDGNYLYAGSSDGMIYRSTDKGVSWSSVYTFSGSGEKPVKSLLVHPDFPHIIYAAVKSSSFSQYAVMMSTDKGANWQAYTAPMPAKVNQLSIDPIDPDILYASTENGIYHFPATVKFSAQYNPDWNMASVPSNVFDFSRAAVWPDNILLSTVTTYDPIAGGYVPATNLEFGNGYWAKFSGEQTVSYVGSPVYTTNTTEATTINVSAGWNMIGSRSIPIATADIIQNPPNNIESPFYKFNVSGYEAVTTIEPGVGIWLKATQNGELIFSGHPAESIPPAPSPPGTFTLVAPINGVTTATTPRLSWQPSPGAQYYEVFIQQPPNIGAQVSYDHISATSFLPPGTLTEKVLVKWWVFAKGCGYTKSDEQTFFPDNDRGTECEESITSYQSLDNVVVSDSKGSSQRLYIHNEGRLRSNGFLRFDEMPPAPPGTRLDVRFASNNVVEKIRPRQGAKNIPIKIKHAIFPVTVSWDFRKENTLQYWLHTGRGNDKIKISGKGSYSLNSAPNGNIGIIASAVDPCEPPDPSKIAIDNQEISSSNEMEPDIFLLQQNTPNPFNPMTMINYQLAEDAHVTLKVYNTVGQEVSILVDETQSAGYKTARFDAGNLPSGVYYYRIQAGSFSDIKKMVLVR